MDNEFAPIETHYRGYRFRSRLEARWAVVFDTLGWHWEYEPEGFDLPAGDYLPDFRVELPGEGTRRWWEIKPPRAAQTADTLCDLRWVDLVRASGLALLVAHGLPDPDAEDWDVWSLEPARLVGDVGPADALRLRTRGYGPDRSDLGRAWVAALAAGRGARFEHHGSDPSALPRDPVPLAEALDGVRDAMQRAAGDR